MAVQEFEAQIKKFIADGNEFNGEIPNVDKYSRLTWRGQGNKLTLGEGCNLVRTRIIFGGRKAEIKIGDHSVLRGILRADSNCTLFLGKGTRINRVCNIRACEGGKILVGDECLFSDVIVRNSDLHKVFDLKTGERINEAKDIHIEDRVWLAETVNVYKGVTIGQGSIIAARSTVLKNIPSNCVAAGTPAKVIREGTSWHR